VILKNYRKRFYPISVIGLLLLFVVSILASIPATPSAHAGIIIGNDSGSSGGSGGANTQNGAGWNRYDVNGSDPFPSDSRMNWSSFAGQCRNEGYTHIWAFHVLDSSGRRFLYRPDVVGYGMANWWNWNGINNRSDLRYNGLNLAGSYNAAQEDFTRLGGEGGIESVSWFCGGEVQMCPFSMNDPRVPAEYRTGYNLRNGFAGQPFTVLGISNISQCFEAVPTTKSCGSLADNGLSNTTHTFKSGFGANTQIDINADPLTTCFEKICPNTLPNGFVGYTPPFTRRSNANSLRFSIDTNDSAISNACFVRQCGERPDSSLQYKSGMNSSSEIGTRDWMSTCFETPAPQQNSSTIHRCRNVHTQPEGTYTSSCPAVKETGFEPYTYPSVQFLGGSVLSRGAISTSRFATRESVSGAPGNISLNNTGRVFSSWTDFSIVSGGKVVGFGSGAAYGYNGSIVGANSAQKSELGDSSARGGAVISTRNKQGGGLVGNIKNQCAFSKMTSMNVNCSNTTAEVGNFANVGDKLVRTNAQIDTLKAWFRPTKTGSGINLSTRQNYDNTNATCSTGTATLNIGNTLQNSIGNNRDDNVATPQRIDKNNFHVVCATGTVVIHSNIEYGDDLVDADSTPQVIIFANNISIGANVSRIDAWLIADNIVETCPSSAGAACGNNQLVINGPVFAGEIRLRRFYHNMKQPGEGLQDKGCSKNVALQISKYRTNVTGIRTTTRTWNLKEFAGQSYIAPTPAVPATENSPGSPGSPGRPFLPPRNRSNSALPNSTNTSGSIDSTRIRESTTFQNDACELAEPAEIFNLRTDAKLWAYSEMLKRDTQTQINGLTEVLPWW
jgi:hypothetical protein